MKADELNIIAYNGIRKQITECRSKNGNAEAIYLNIIAYNGIRVTIAERTTIYWKMTAD